MRTLVVGASKGIGLEFVRQAAGQAMQVRAMARSADEMSVPAGNIEPFKGDALNGADVAQACEGVDVVVVVLGVAPSLERMLRPVTLFSQATEVIVSHMAQMGIRRLIAVTGFGAGVSYQKLSFVERVPFNIVLGQAYADKSRQEDIIKNSALDWTIVRPTILTNGRLTKRYQVFAKPSRWRNGLISRADVADFLLREVNRPSEPGSEFVLAY